MRKILLSISLVGIILFGGAYVASFLDPILIERSSRELIRIELEKRLKEKVEVLSNAKIVVLAAKALGRNEKQIEAERQEIIEAIPSKIASVMDAMLRRDCECRRRLAESADRTADERITSLVRIRENISKLVESGYNAVSKSLLREFRIFTASNAVAFALLGLVTVLRRAATLQLSLPAVVLIGATLITSGLYLFGQNWLHTVVHGDYVGFAYSAYLGAAALFLADVCFNRARVSTQIVNGALSAVGHAASAVPC